MPALEVSIASKVLASSAMMFCGKSWKLLVIVMLGIIIITMIFYYSLPTCDRHVLFRNVQLSMIST